MAYAKPRKPDAPDYSYKRALNYAMWLLGRRAYSRKEVERKLLTKTNAEVAEAVLARLVDLALLDDAAYAGRIVETQKTRKGKLALRQVLAHKGIDEQMISQSLDPVSDEEQIATAKEVLAKSQWRFKGDIHARRRKAYAFLARRGFSGEVVSEVLEQLFSRD
ncbi:MAG: regulatory protein RecX [Deinococcota bacterium]